MDPTRNYYKFMLQLQKHSIYDCTPIDYIKSDALAMIDVSIYATTRYVCLHIMHAHILLLSQDLPCTKHNLQVNILG